VGIKKHARNPIDHALDAYPFSTVIVCVLEHPYETILSLTPTPSSPLEEEDGGLMKLQFFKGRKAGTKFLPDAFAGAKIKIFSACWTKPFTLLLTERFERDL